MISLFNYALHLKALIFAIVVSCGVLSGNPSENEAEPTLPSDITVEEIFQEELRNILSKYDPLYFPEIPLISVNPREDIDISLSFVNATFSGLSSNLYVLNVTMPGLRPNDKDFEIDIDITLLQLYAAEYAAGGHILNLPFSGESYMKLTLEDLSIKVGMKFQTFNLTCVENGSTWYQLDVRKPVLNFNNLNPGTDQGELVNTALGGMVPDVVDYLAFLLNGEWHDTIDEIVVDVVDSIRCTRNSTSSTTASPDTTT